VSRSGIGPPDQRPWSRFRISYGGRTAVDSSVFAGSPVDLAELVVGVGEADAKSFDLAEAAFALGFGDAGDE
jgi:hypothetical protein